MSTRHNKKRKGRNNINSRDRTVTTLIEDPNTSFLTPIASEEAGGQANLMSSPFSVASSSGGGGTSNVPSSGYSGSYGFAAYMSSMLGPNQHQSTQDLYPPSALPPGQSDLEVLEKLKEAIKNGQHEFYRAIPQPAALANIYLGPAAEKAPGIPHPEQTSFQGPGHDRSGVTFQDKVTPSSAVLRRSSSGADLNHRLSQDARKPADQLVPAASVALTTVNNTYDSSKVPPSQGSRNVSNGISHQGPSKDEPRNYPNATSPPLSVINDKQEKSLRYESSALANAPKPSIVQQASTEKPDASRPAADREGPPVSGESLHNGRPGETQHLPAKDDLRSRDGLWVSKERSSSQDDRRGRYDTGSSRADEPRSPPGNDYGNRNAGPRDPRALDRDRDRNVRDRDRDRDFRDRDRHWETDWDRDRDRRDSRWRDDPRPARRPPPDQRHYEPRYASDMPPPPRRYDPPPKAADDTAAVSRRPDLPPRDVTPAASVRPETGDRAARPPPAVDPQNVRSAAGDPAPRPPVEIRSRMNSLDDRSARPIPAGITDDRRGPLHDEHAARLPSASLPSVATKSPILDQRTSRIENIPSAPDAHVDRSLSLGTAPPPDRNQPLPPRPDIAFSARQLSLEERVSHPPVSSSDRGRPLPPDDRLNRPTVPPVPSDRGVTRVPPPLDDRRAAPPAPRSSAPSDRAPVPEDRGRPPLSDRFARPPSPQDRGIPPARPMSYRSPVPAGSAVHDEPRTAKPPLSPPRRPDLPPARLPERELSRERGSYRLEYSNYNDDRRLPLPPQDFMEIDVPSRFADNRVPYHRVTPPPPVDFTNDRPRGVYPPPSPPRSEAPYIMDLDRHYPVDDRHDWQYSGPSRDWTGPGEDPYWKDHRPWDRSAPPDRDRIDRELRPASRNGWETRDERERRIGYGPPSPSAPSYDGSAPRPLSARLTDGYPAPVEDRSYPPRDLDRARYPPPPRSVEGSVPPYTRTRMRSPSPLGRRPGPADDARPPLKRPRDEGPGVSDYYTPSNRDVVASRPPPMSAPSDYSRPLSPPGGYYDSRREPGFSAAGSSGGPPHDRDYPGRDRVPSFGPSSYERPRSPIPSRGPPLYGRPPYPRDDRRYDGPPPRTS